MSPTTVPITMLAQDVGGFFGALLMVGLVGLVFGFWLWALVDCLKREFPGNEKIVWVLVIILLHVLGAVIYLAMGRQQGRPPHA